MKLIRCPTASSTRCSRWSTDIVESRSLGAAVRYVPQISLRVVSPSAHVAGANPPCVRMRWIDQQISLLWRDSGGTSIKAVLKDHAHPDRRPDPVAAIRKASAIFSRASTNDGESFDQRMLAEIFAISPLANPTTSSCPPNATQRILPLKMSPPAGSNTISASGHRLVP